MPLLARWPEHIRAGSTSAALLAHLDMAASFAALVGETIPVGQCADSVNVLPALLGQSQTGLRVGDSRRRHKRSVCTAGSAIGNTFRPAVVSTGLPKAEQERKLRPDRNFTISAPI